MRLLDACTISPANDPIARNCIFSIVKFLIVALSTKPKKERFIPVKSITSSSQGASGLSIEISPIVPIYTLWIT